jgi:hypothetical protein
MTLRGWFGSNRCAFCRGPLPEDAVKVGRRRFCSERHAEKYRFERALARTRRSLGGSGGAGCCK